MSHLQSPALEPGARVLQMQVLSGLGLDTPDEHGVTRPPAFLAMTSCKTKTSRPQNGTRGRILAVSPKFIAYKDDALCADNHRLPNNAGIASQPTNGNVLTWEAQEGTSTGLCRVQFHRSLCTSLAASASLLSSVTACNFDCRNYLQNGGDVKA